jgi:serine phosphatase RsbU (regulator of sigma subunit)
MELQIGVAKVNKYAVSASGDTLEIIERPGGGISLVLADGQRSGKSAKRISNKVVRKVVSLLAEGVRDGAAARAASDYLFHERQGKVMATLNIASVDLLTQTAVIVRNNPAPVFVGSNNGVEILDDACDPVGVYRQTRPVIKELSIVPGLTLLFFTDGITHAGERQGNPIDILAEFEAILAQPDKSAQDIADHFLNLAVARDQGRPSDDISVVALRVQPEQSSNVRRLSVWLPLGHG